MMSEKRFAFHPVSVLLGVLALLAALACASALPAKAWAEEVEVATWSDLYDALQVDGNSITLTADVKFGEGEGDHAGTALSVPAGTTVTLDLAGHVVDRGLTAAINWGQAIVVNGSLTITDSVPAATHDPAIT